MKSGILTSEFWAKIGGIVVMIANKAFGWALDPIEISAMFATIMAYIGARTWAKKGPA